MTTPIAPARRPAAARVLLAAGLGLALLVAPACKYNGHRTMGATEKLVASDVNHVAKIGGTFFVSLGDSILAPAEMLVDQVVYDPQYVPEHKYFSYAGSRTIARSDMGHGYQWLAAFPTFLIDTVWLILTGPIDIVWVLVWGPSETPPSEAEAMMGATGS